jgi:hypothetical protein
MVREEDTELLSFDSDLDKVVGISRISSGHSPNSGLFGGGASSYQWEQGTLRPYLR